MHRVAAQLASGCRRLASQPWVIPAPAGDERTAIIAGVTEGVLDAMERGRDGRDLVQLVSDALANQLPHDRIDLFAAAPAPECWTLLSADRAAAAPVRLDASTIDAVDELVHHFGARELVRIDDLAAGSMRWPAVLDQRGATRIRSLLAARLAVAGEFVGWLCLAQRHPGLVPRRRPAGGAPRGPTAGAARRRMGSPRRTRRRVELATETDRAPRSAAAAALTRPLVSEGHVTSPASAAG